MDNDFFGSIIDTITNLFGQGSEIAKGLPWGQIAGGAAQGAASALPAFMQLMGGKPDIPMDNPSFQAGATTPLPSPTQVQTARRNQQAQGIYEGGAATPESLAAGFGPGVTPEQIKSIIAQIQAQGGGAY